MSSRMFGASESLSYYMACGLLMLAGGTAMLYTLVGAMHGAVDGARQGRTDLRQCLDSDIQVSDILDGTFVFKEEDNR